MRYARICPNTLSWCQPSGGSKGKPNSFPGIRGFGFDEWLLGAPTINGGHLNGFRAGFIQAYKKQMPNFIDDVTLYLLGPGLSRTSVIEVRQCRRMTDAEAAYVFNQYQSSGFISSMQNQLSQHGLSMPQNQQPLDHFNVVFLPSSASLLQKQPCTSGHTRYSNLYR